MKSLNVIIASSDRASANRIEVQLQDACFERVLVDCKRTSYLADVENLSRMGWADLTILSPDHLMLASGSRCYREAMTQSLTFIRRIRRWSLMPVIAFNVLDEDVVTVLNAGVEVVFGPSWKANQFKYALDRVLRLPDRVVQKQAKPEPELSRWESFNNFLKDELLNSGA